MKRILTYQIEENTTIEKFLKAKLGFSRKQISALKFREDGIRVNGKRRRVTERLLPADGLKGTGAGGIDGDDQILDFHGVPVFERLQKEKLFRPGKTVTVGNVVKTVKICLCLLPGDGEAP